LPLLWCITSGLLLTCGAEFCLAFASTNKTTITHIKLHPSLEGDLIEVTADQPFDFVTYTLTEPNRLIIDPVEVDIVSALPKSKVLDGGVVKGWQFRHPAGELSSQKVDYLSFDLSEPSEHLLESADPSLRIRVRSKHQRVLMPLTNDTALAALRPTAQAATQPVTPGSLLPATGDSLLPALGEVWDLGQSLVFGLGRHRPVRISQKEVDLAQQKVREARRALYPAATLKASWTDGIASDVDFREYTTGLQMEIPLYYSGRLMETYRQSLVNLQVAQKRRTKVESDFSMELAESYFQLVGAKAGLIAQEGLVAETEDFERDVRARFEQELLTRLEILNVQSQVNQSRFQRTNAENDVVLARIKFLQRLKLDHHALVEVPDTFPSIETESVDLEEALRLAAQYRPDIQINTLLVKFHEYEERISKAKGKLKVDLSGFIGSSASAYDTEALDTGDDYFIGIKATRAWGGGNSANLSVTETKTSPRLGQTTRTDTTVYSAEFGILDAMQGISEIKQAQVNLEKAHRDLEEARSSIFQEVQEAYLSFNKARLQLEYARQKIVFRQEQVKILKAQASLNEALPSQVLESIIKLTEEKVGESQALSNYHVALAKLNKAIGLPRHYE